MSIQLYALKKWLYIVFDILDKVEKHLDECTLDNLIIVSRKVGQKGSKVGIEQEGFRLPSPPVSLLY